jgi:hypothetical protein
MSDNDTPEEKEEDQVTLISQNTIISEAGPQNFSGYSNQMTGLALYFYQFWGLFIKRMIYTKRRFILYTIMVIISSCTLKKTENHFSIQSLPVAV